jgi:spore maturation protein CgeB
MCLKGRDFEVPMSKSLYLTQHNPELSQVYDLGTEILTYNDAEDCANLIHKVLRDPVWAQSIRDAGYARCLREHTYEKRWEELFKYSGLIN